MAKTAGTLSRQSAIALFCHQYALLLVAVRGGNNNLRTVQGQLLPAAGTPSRGSRRRDTGEEGSKGQISDPSGERVANHGIDVLDRSDAVKKAIAKSMNTLFISHRVDSISWGTKNIRNLNFW